MRAIVLISLMLMGCGTTAQDSTTTQWVPELVIKGLLVAGNTLLEDEPYCDQAFSQTKLGNLVLTDHLATLMASSLNPDSVTQISTQCSASKFEQAQSIVDVWDCSVTFTEKREEEVISSSTVAFNLAKKDYQYLKGSLRCF